MRWITRTLVLGVLTLGLAGCGPAGGEGTDGVASLGGGTTTTAAAGGGRSPAGDGQDRFFEFARCMRERGVDVPDPEPGGGPVKIERGRGVQMEDPRFQEAQAACAKEIGGMGPGEADPAKRQEFQDKALAFARCMREHGIDMPDPTFGEGGMVKQVVGDDVSPEDPRFQEAEQACESLLPHALGRGGPNVEVRP